MKRLTLFYIIFACFSLLLQAQPKQELRAVWLTTLEGLDWPSTKGTSLAVEQKQKQELCHILDLLKKANVNTILFQTRIRGTVTYPSRIEPWDGCVSGRFGTAPNYDPLQFAIEETHKRGMEIHAWVVTVPTGKWNSYGARNLRQTHPELMRHVGEDACLNPEDTRTADYIASICEEITQRYDIDGIHLDYIRYPETWNIRGSRQQARDNITRIVRTIHQKVKGLKPWVKLSCSPLGKFDDLTRFPSGGWNAYNKVCQDAQGWLRDGLMDQLFPMMYYDGKHYYPFAADWSEHRYDREIAAGLGIYRLIRSEGNWNLNAIERQMYVARQLGLGHCYFRSRFLTDNTKGLYDFVCDFDSYPAVVPPMLTFQPAPSAPTSLQIERTTLGDNISWSGAVDNSDGDYLTYNVYASTTQPVDITDGRNLIAIRQTQQQLSVRRSADDAPLYYTVTAVNRYGMESTPAKSQRLTANSQPLSSNTLLPNDGNILRVENCDELPGAFYAIYSMQGIHLAIKPFSSQVFIGDLPKGVYELRTASYTGTNHHVGYFLIK
ncbi:MAG: family 10 glycosylhydrolase [Prevotella sp.]|nr:family 10 glycosylhydrolase [Prevotella sp.]